MQHTTPQRTSRRAPAVLGGAACGAAARFATLSFWPAEAQFVPTLALTISGLFVWGLISVGDRFQLARTAVGAFVGTASSIGILVIIAISATPRVCVAYIAAVPLCAIAGLAAGVLLAVAIQRRDVE
ncbi:hypothetical protein [Mycolicibacterium stellerae]|uniref:hypothetical protein n=1 Tax=Mycolicibacterium stellerae TaxID=2358193 RepID=UPI0013DE392A|nr:hypothetical protein [Mycolicibacterium stellerae]